MRASMRLAFSVFTWALAACGSSDGPPAAAARAEGGAVDATAAPVSDAASMLSEASEAPEAAFAVGDASHDAGDTPSGSSCSASVAGIAVDERELSGYPSYAIDGCLLVYVARGSGGASGDLYARELRGGTEVLVAAAGEVPRRPSLGALGPESDRAVIAWEATLDGKSVVRVAHEGITRTLAGPFDHAAEPRAVADGVVFTAWIDKDEGGDTDVMLYLPATGAIVPAVTGPGQQRFAAVSSAYVVATDFSEDPDGRYDALLDLADLAVYDRRSGQTTKRPQPGKQAFPTLPGGGKVAYLHWESAEIHPEPKLADYHLRVGPLSSLDFAQDRELAHVRSGAVPYVRPAARDGIVEWVDSGGGKTRFWRAPTDSLSAPQSIDTIGGVALYAPAPGPNFTVLAVRSTFQDPVRLSAVAR